MQNRMKILEVCNNYGSNTDGIGKYAKIIIQELKKNPEIAGADYVSEYTTDKNRFKMLFSLRMSKTLWKAAKMVADVRYDIVMLEYPFQEYNPLILIFYSLLKEKCQISNTKLVLSVHEYIRANPLRKYVVEFMARRAGLVIVSETETQKRLQRFNKNTCLRNMIGTIFPERSVRFEEKTDEFLYFGLVNRSKAFTEMIDAWRQFNATGQYHLTIISSSDISELIPLGRTDIQILKDLPDAEVEQYLRICSYIILPIRPEITEINGTFKTGALFGCICIGHFEENLAAQRFVINVDDYSAVVFSEGMQRACRLDSDTRQALFKEAIEYGRKFTPETSAQELTNLYNTIISQKEKE